jgi:hypothetical protein
VGDRYQAGRRRAGVADRFASRARDGSRPARHVAGDARTGGAVAGAWGNPDRDRSVRGVPHRMSLRRSMLASVAGEKPGRPQFVGIAEVLRLPARQRHQPCLGLQRDRRFPAEARAIVKCSHRAFGHGALDATLDGLMMQSESPTDRKKRRVFPIGQQWTRRNSIGFSNGKEFGSQKCKYAKRSRLLTYSRGSSRSRRRPHPEVRSYKIQQIGRARPVRSSLCIGTLVSNAKLPR